MSGSLADSLCCWRNSRNQHKNRDRRRRRRSRCDVRLRHQTGQKWRRRGCALGGWGSCGGGAGGGQRGVLAVNVLLHYSKQLKSPCARLRGRRGVNEKDSRTGIGQSRRAHVKLENILHRNISILFFFIQHRHNQLPLCHCAGGRDLLLVLLLPSPPTTQLSQGREGKRWQGLPWKLGVCCRPTSSVVARSGAGA